MHRTCTNNPVKSDRRNWLIHREVQFEVCFLRPCSEEGSDATKPIKNNSRLRQQCRTSKLTIRRRGGSWVEPLPIAENWQVRMADQAMYHQGNQSVFVGGRLWTLLPPPAYMSRKVLKNTKQTEGSFTSVQMVHTHTHHLSHTTLSHTTLSHTIFHTQLCHPPSFTHNSVTHHLSHTTLSPTIFHAQLCHPPSFTHNLVTHHLHNFLTQHLSHTTLSPTIFHTQLCHPPSFTDNFVTHTHNFVRHHLSHTTLSPTIYHTQPCHTQLCHTPSFTHHLSHTTLSPTIFYTQPCHTQLCHTISFTHNFVTHHLHNFVTHHLYFVTHLRFVWQAWGKLCLAARLVAVGRPGRRGTLRGRRGAGAPRHFASQAWHLVTSTFVSRGRRGPWRHLPSFCVAGVVQVALGGALGRRWSPGAPRHFAWQAWHLVTSTLVSRSRRGTWRHLPSFCVAGVVQVGLGGAWSPLVARGAAALCVAGVALGDIHLRFTWQAWHLATSTFVLRGRCGTSCTWWRAWSPLVARGAAALCVAGVALGDIHLRFTWQAWHLATSTFVLRGRRGTSCTWWRAWSPLVALSAAALCVAGVALGDIHLRFAWQAWHLVTSTFVLRGRRGTSWTWWRAWSPLVARGAAALCVAGVALGDIHLRFTKQAWHLATSTCVWPGRSGTSCTWWHAWSPLVARAAAALCVAGVALGDIHLRFAWQAWHLATSTFVLRGKGGTSCTWWRAWAGFGRR